MKPFPSATLAVIVLAGVGLIGCKTSLKGLPPKPKTVQGETARAEHFTMLAWDNGLRLLVVDDFPGSIQRKSDFSLGDDSPYVFVESVTAGDVSMSWTMETKDGQTGRFELDETTYDLADGAVFVARRTAEGFVVEQFMADLSNVELDEEQVGSFVTQHVEPSAKSGESESGTQDGFTDAADPGESR